MAYLKNLTEYLELTAKRVPDKTAFADETEKLSFSDLLSLGKSIGTAVAAVTERVNAPVAVFTDRSVYPITGFIGALMSGNFYVPVDATMPPERMASIMEELSPAAIL